MKKNTIVFTLFLTMLYVVLSSDIDGAAHHGHGNVTGSATGVVGHCQTSSCHGSNNPLTVVQLQVLDTSTMLPITTYNAMQTYLVTLTGDATAVTTSLPKFGFMASAVLGNHTQAGTYVIPSALASDIHTYPCGATTIVEHTVPLLPTVSGTNKYATQFYWTAPPPASDSVMFFSLLNAVNGDGGSSGDYPNAAPVVTIYENPATATCGVPTGLIHSSITQSSAYLQWTSVPGGVSYKIQFRPTGTTTWSVATATTNSATVTGLTASTTYEFEVQTVCSGSPSSFTATADTLTTAAPSGVPGVNMGANAFTVRPNPTTGVPTISYNLSVPNIVSLAIYDMTGREVTAVLKNELQNEGSYEYSPIIIAPGMYFVRLSIGGASNTVKFIKQ